ncbi:CgeB family protein [Metabacillus sediminilitoris]|nr:glycosyltransferase [Metabacillus sediminilitoris]
MRLMFIYTSQNTLSHLDSNIISAFKTLEKNLEDFTFGSVFYNSMQDLLKISHKVRSFRPDVILKCHPNVPASLINMLKKYATVGIWVVNDPYNLMIHEKSVKPYDFVISQDASCVSFYNQKNKPCIHLPLAVNPKKYHPMKVPEKYQYDISFIGNAWPERIPIIDNLAPFLLKKKFIIIGKNWNKLKSYKKMQPYIIDTLIPPREVAKYYNGSKIILNIHRGHNDVKMNHKKLPAFTPNNRTFDIAACSAFQLCDCRQGLDHLYKINDEVVCYNSLEDLKSKINEYLKNEKERERISNNALRRTLTDHTYEKRLQYLLHCFSKGQHLKK